MKSNQIVEWQQTKLGIWTIVALDTPAAKKPARKISALTAKQLPRPASRPTEKSRPAPRLRAPARA